MKLYEIDEAIMGCLDTETGEIIDEEKLTELEMARDEKVENVGCWIKDLKAEIEALKAEKLAFAERQKVAENKLESLKHWMAYALDGKSFKTAKVAVSFRHSQAVEVTDPDAFVDWAVTGHDDLLTYRDPEPNKTAIKQALKDGLAVTGCQLKDNVSTIVK